MECGRIVCFAKDVIVLVGVVGCNEGGLLYWEQLVVMGVVYCTGSCWLLWEWFIAEEAVGCKITEINEVTHLQNNQIQTFFLYFMSALDLFSFYSWLNALRESLSMP